MLSNLTQKVGYDDSIITYYCPIIITQVQLVTDSILNTPYYEY